MNIKPTFLTLHVVAASPSLQRRHLVLSFRLERLRIYNNSFKRKTKRSNFFGKSLKFETNHSN